MLALRNADRQAGGVQPGTRPEGARPVNGRSTLGRSSLFVMRRAIFEVVAREKGRYTSHTGNTEKAIRRRRAELSYGSRFRVGELARAKNHAARRRRIGLMPFGHWRIKSTISRATSHVPISSSMRLS